MFEVPRWWLHTTGAKPPKPDWTRSDMNDVTPERWLPAVGWEGFYEVSDLGRVYSTRRPGSRGCILKTAVGIRGHLSVGLYAKAAGRAGCRDYVHRLVAAAFIGPCPEGCEVRHLDGNPANNRADNLTYSTHAVNMHDTIAHHTAYWANQPCCVNGHEFTPANTRIRLWEDGTFRQRCCRACEREHSRRKNKRRRENRDRPTDNVRRDRERPVSAGR